MTTPAMNLLTEANTSAFLDRFSNCEDGVIRSFTFTYPYGWFTRPAPAEPEQTRVDILLSVRDWQTNGRWCNLALLLLDVREFKLIELRRGYNSVLSDGLKLGWFEGLVFADLSLDDHDLRSVEGFRRASRYVAARELRWRVEAYDR